MARPKKEEWNFSNYNSLKGTIKVKDSLSSTNADEVKEYEVIDIKMALPIGFKIKLKEPELLEMQYEIKINIIKKDAKLVFEYNYI